jgi:hypothetical protein
MSAFEDATTVERLRGEDGDFRAVIPDGWQQGKGAFGGVVVAILARALLASERDRNRTLRSLTADLCGPALPGEAIIQVTLLRRGASITFLDARLFQGEELVAHASASLAAPRPVAQPAISSVRPHAPPWHEVPVVPVEPPVGPVFARNYEFRSTGPYPFSNGSEPVTAGWIRERDMPKAIDAPGIAGLLDAWWPTSFSVEAAPRAVATIGYTMQLLVDPTALPVDEPLFYRARGVASGDNFFVEMRELWFEDQLIALNQQTFALLR